LTTAGKERESVTQPGISLSLIEKNQLITVPYEAELIHKA
jgi:hypothetical protein